MTSFEKCLFCKRKGSLVKIHEKNAKTGTSVSDYILALLGDVEQYLQQEYWICIRCSQVLLRLIYMRNYMFETISLDEDSQYSNPEYYKFSLLYQNFINPLISLKRYYDQDFEPEESSEIEEDSEYEEDQSNLLQPLRSSPYDNYSSRGSTPYNDREVATYTSRKQSVTTDDDKSISDIISKYDDNSILKVKRTRSVSRLHDRANSQLANAYICDFEGEGNFRCNVTVNSLKELTKHKVTDHKLLANYCCGECYNKKFTSQQDLDRHSQECHRVLITNCLKCSKQLDTVQDLQKHLAEHRVYEVPCRYCDMFFITGKELDQHKKEKHARKRSNQVVKLIRQKSQRKTIIDRIDYKYYRDENYLTGPIINWDYSSRILLQQGKERDSPELTFVRTPERQQVQQVSKIVPSQRNGNEEDKSNEMEILDTGQDSDEIREFDENETEDNIADDEDDDENLEVMESFRYENNTPAPQYFGDIPYFPDIQKEVYARDIILSSPEPWVEDNCATNVKTTEESEERLKDPPESSRIEQEAAATKQDWSEKYSYILKRKPTLILVDYFKKEKYKRELSDHVKQNNTSSTSNTESDDTFTDLIKNNRVNNDEAKDVYVKPKSLISSQTNNVYKKRRKVKELKHDKRTDVVVNDS